MSRVDTHIWRIEGWKDEDIPWEFSFYGTMPTSTPRITIALFESDDDIAGNLLYEARKDLFRLLWTAYWEVDREEQEIGR